MSAPENPPAFPTDGRIQHGTAYDGMSLRDYFAGQALTGIASAIRGPGCADWDYYSRAACHIADAMLAERAKTGGAA